MKKIVSILFIIIISFTTNLSAEDSKSVKRISEGNANAKIIIIAYESLTCGHCADFHKNVYPNLKQDFIEKGLVKIEFRHFPLDIAAFNASKIGQCKNDGNPDLLNILFSGQKKWARGKTPEETKIYLKKFLKDEDISVDFEKCLNDKAIEDFILNDRIEGVKKFKVNATPTIIINDKKFEKALNYKNIKKYLEKLI
tara:strand:+ start:175 stop:765 length:591 start_codon:yes stop_codon:yes gene_type:complete